MSFVRTMLEEKELMNTVMDLEVRGVSHSMPVEVVVEYIENCPQYLQNDINDRFSYIDYKNGDIMNFVKHLAVGIAQM